MVFSADEPALPQHDSYQVLHWVAYDKVPFDGGTAKLVFCVRWWPAAEPGEKFELEVQCRLRTSLRLSEGEAAQWWPVLLWDDADSVGFKWYHPTLPDTAGCQEVDVQTKCIASHFEKKRQAYWVLKLAWEGHSRADVPGGLWAVLQLQDGQHVLCPGSGNGCFEVPLRKDVEAQVADLQDQIHQLQQQLKQADVQPRLHRTLLPRKEAVSKVQAHQAATLRRIWREELLHRRGRIRVFGRIRGLRPDEHFSGERCAVTKLSETEVALPQMRRSFEFDLVFGPEAPTSGIWDEVSPLVDSVFDQADMHACVMAYGQTGAGKTFTMEGSDEQPGLISHCVEHLFKRAAEERAAFLRDGLTRSCAMLSVSMIEIYQEQLYDLLNPSSLDGGRLSLRHEGGDSGPEVKGLSLRSPQSLQEALTLYKEGTKLRRLGVSERNMRSSRSHTVFSLYVKREAPGGDENVSKISLVDLAGSERQSTSSEYDRARVSEAGSINRSLTSLGKVVQACIARSASRHPDAERAHVPYRDSVLTRLLSDSIGGQAKTLLIVHVTPHARDAQESRCTLQFAANAACVQERVASRHRDTSKVPTPCRVRSGQT